MAQQIKSITSEALESAYRSLTPSQEGFTEDLMASNVILPIIDLTEDASGASTPEFMQRAASFGGITAFSQAGAGTTTIINTAGFWQLIMSATIEENPSNDNTIKLNLDDGVTTKTFWQIGGLTGTTSVAVEQTINQVFFLPTGITLSVTCSTNNYTVASGSIRQVADVNGTVVLPSGFTPQ